MVPGFVSVMVAPAKSSGTSLLVRALSTSVSYRGVERREVHALRVLDNGDDQGVAAILLLHVHRQAEVHRVADRSGAAFRRRPGRRAS